jgi:hypothetical protein
VVTLTPLSKGQVLCVLDAPELNAAQAQSQSNSIGAKAKYETSRTTYLRLLKAAQTATEANKAIEDYLVIV